jgi:hypothetical protein
VNESRVQERVLRQKFTFDQLLSKYKKAVPKDRPVKKYIEVTFASRQTFFS